jgi:hypothetical protein
MPTRQSPCTWQGPEARLHKPFHRKGQINVWPEGQGT